MGIGKLESDFEERIVSTEALNWKKIVLCELGNIERKIEPRMVAKKYYETVLGVQEHVSIDINGKWGAIALNLDLPVPNNLEGKFDIVTNYGTGEHVDNQFSFFRNVHNLCKKGGIIIHALVPVGHWPNHCRYYYDETFVNCLAEACNYETLAVDRQVKYIEKPDTALIMVAYKKIDDKEFLTECEFKELEILDTGSTARTGDYTNIRKDKSIGLATKTVSAIKKAGRKASGKVSMLYEPVEAVNTIFKNGVEVTYPQCKLQALIGEGAACNSTLSNADRLFLFSETGSHIQNGKILEIGSYLGASAIILAEALKQNSQNISEPKVYCVDTWQNDAMTEGLRDTYQTFLDNTKNWSNIVLPVRGNSQSVVLPEEEYDVVFIDGDHSYEGCRSDVQRFAPLVREGGCLILDDHISYTGVTKVVGELLTSGEWYIGASHYNVVSLYCDRKSVSKAKRLRRWNRSL